MKIPEIRVFPLRFTSARWSCTYRLAQLGMNLVDQPSPDPPESTLPAELAFLGIFQTSRAWKPEKLV
jgi:hypothetical protein